MSGYVVTRPFFDSNVGSNLASLAGAVWLGDRLGRTVVVDWRGLSQLTDASLNYFTEFFQPPAEVEGVPALYAPVPDLPDYAPPAENAAWLSPPQARQLAHGAAHEESEFIVLQAYHGLDRLHAGPEAERMRLLRSFYGQIRPSAEIAAAIEDWWSQNVAGAFVVGVNVRTGNGQYFGKGMPYASRVDVSVFENSRRFLRALERACRARLRALPKTLRDDAVIFYATDSAEMSELLTELPNARTRRTVFPPPGTGDTYRFEGGDYSDHDSIVDTLADMFLLARCDALVYNSSLFNQYARVLTGNFGGNQAHIESLFLRTAPRRLAAAMRRRLARSG